VENKSFLTSCHQKDLQLKKKKKEGDPQDHGRKKNSHRPHNSRVLRLGTGHLGMDQSPQKKNWREEPAEGQTQPVGPGHLFYGSNGGGKCLE